MVGNFVSDGRRFAPGLGDWLWLGIGGLWGCDLVYITIKLKYFDERIVYMVVSPEGKIVYHFSLLVCAMVGAGALAYISYNVKKIYNEVKKPRHSSVRDSGGLEKDVGDE